MAKLTLQTFVSTKTSRRCLEDDFRLRLQKTFSRCLDQHDYIRLNHTSSEDVFKTLWSRPTYSSWSYFLKTSSGRFEDVFNTSSGSLGKTSFRRFQDVLEKRLQDISRHLQNVFKMSCKNVSRRFQDVSLFKLFLLTRLRDLFNTFLRRTAKTVI